jgi:hypothetical protein
MCRSRDNQGLSLGRWYDHLIGEGAGKHLVLQLQATVEQP